MNVRKLILLVGALMVAAVTAMMAKSMFTGASAPQAQAAAVPAGPEILVATRSLPVGTIIDAEALRFQAWPKELVQTGAYFVKGGEGVNPQDLIGTVVRNEITAGQPITMGALVKPGERGFLAAALGPGMRAVTVAVSDTSGVAGFVFPGDRVDIVLTQEVSGGGDGEPLKVSETILRNVRVLATDQRTTAAVDDKGNSVPMQMANVTLEATPRIAEKIAVAQKIGQLTLSLRSIADNTAELERAIASGEVEVPEGDDPRAERRMLLAIASKPIDSNPSATVGGEVSRFQRSTVPAKPQQARDTAPAGPAVSAQGAQPAPKPMGPSVRVARGNNVTIVPVGAR
jgi:pilus assembly protein CpaB